ncbi:MAG TPA: hypothetical protein VF600_16080 [Abditibacteriaceae bacterium]|jgi:hypothetical protein
MFRFILFILATLFLPQSAQSRFQVTLQREMQSAKDPVLKSSEAVFSPDGTFLVVSSAEQAKVWNIRTGSFLVAVQGQFSAPDSYTISSQPSGLWFSSNSDFLLASGGDIYKLNSSIQSSAAVHLMPSSTKISVASIYRTRSIDGLQAFGSRASAWYLAKRLDDRKKRWLEGSFGTVNNVVFSPDGKLVYGFNDGYTWSRSGDPNVGHLILWSARTGKVMRRLPYLDESASRKVSPNYKTVAGVDVTTDTPDIRLIDIESGAVIRRLMPTTNAYAQYLRPVDFDNYVRLRYSLDSKLLAVKVADMHETDQGYAPGESRLYFFDARTGKQLFTPAKIVYGYTPLAFSPTTNSSTLLATVRDSDGVVVLWRVSLS